MEHTPITKQRSPWIHRDEVMIEGVTEATYSRNVSDGTLWTIVGEEPQGWHLSISFRDQRGRLTRYPTWDEIVHARDHLLPADVDFVMWLPKAGEYVALHDTTFHCHEHPPRPEERIVPLNDCPTCHGTETIRCVDEGCCDPMNDEHWRACPECSDDD